MGGVHVAVGVRRDVANPERSRRRSVVPSVGAAAIAPATVVLRPSTTATSHDHDEDERKEVKCA